MYSSARLDNHYISSSDNIKRRQAGKYRVADMHKMSQCSQVQVLSSLTISLTFLCLCVSNNLEEVAKRHTSVSIVPLCNTECECAIVLLHAVY